MLCVRVFLAWMLLLALPLQGWAAVSAHPCAPAAQAMAAAPAGLAAHPAQPLAKGELPASHHAGADGPGASHVCGFCMGACQSVGVPTTHSPLAAEPPSFLDARHATGPLPDGFPGLPDKPPRG